MTSVGCQRQADLESDQVMGDTDASRASLYGATPPVRRKKDLVYRMTRWLRGVGQEFIMLTSLVGIIVLLFAPLVLALIAGSVASVSCLLSLVHMWQAYTAGQYDVIFSDLPALGIAAKIASTSIAYLALLFALSVLISGMIGRREQHFYLIPGVVLSVPALIAYTVSVYLLIRVLGVITGWEVSPFIMIFCYVGFDAAVLGLLVTDLRPARRRRQTRVPRVRQLAISVTHGPEEVEPSASVDEIPTVELPAAEANTLVNSGNSGDLNAHNSNEAAHQFEYFENPTPG